MEFIRTVAEQMEDAARFVVQPGIRQIRVGFILIDNAVELWLRRKARFYAMHRARYPDISAFVDDEGTFTDDEAISKLYADRWKNERRWVHNVEHHFEDTVKEMRRAHPELGRLLTVVSTCHEVRNDLYHAGWLADEVVAPLARAFFHAATEIIVQVKPLSVGYGSNEDFGWLKPYGIDQTEVWSFRPDIVERVVKQLDGMVPSAMPDLGAALSGHLQDRITNVLGCLDFLVENGNGLGSPEHALKSVQFYNDSVADKFPEVVKARNTPAFFEASEKAEAAYRPKVRLKDLSGWRKRAAKLVSETDEKKAVVTWGEIHSQLKPIHEMATDAVVELEAHLDAMMS